MSCVCACPERKMGWTENKGRDGQGRGGGHRRKRKPEYGEERKIEADILIEICYTFVPKMAGNLAYFK